MQDYVVSRLWVLVHKGPCTAGVPLAKLLGTPSSLVRQVSIIVYGPVTFEPGPWGRREA